MYLIRTEDCAKKYFFLEYPIPEIPDDSENKSGMDRVLPKIIGSGRVSGTRQSLVGTSATQKGNIIFRISIGPVLTCVLANQVQIC